METVIISYPVTKYRPGNKNECSKIRCRKCVFEGCSGCYKKSIKQLLKKKSAKGKKK